MRVALLLGLPGLALSPAAPARAQCRCHLSIKPKCADPAAQHDPRIGAPLGLTDDEKAEVAAFLQTLRAPSTMVRGPTGPLRDDAVARLRATPPR